VAICEVNLFVFITLVSGVPKTLAFYHFVPETSTKTNQVHSRMTDFVPNLAPDVEENTDVRTLALLRNNKVSSAVF